MKKLLLTLMMIISSVAYLSADEVLVKECLFGSSYNSESIGSYTVSWSTTHDGFTWDLENWNNNQNGWNSVKCGRKGNASTATITTSTAIPEAISKIEIAIDAITATNVTSIKLYTSETKPGLSSSSPVGDFSKATGVQTVKIESPQANLFYKIEFVCTSGSANGFVEVSSVKYYADDSDPDDDRETVTLSFDEKVYNANLGEEFNAPKLNVNPSDAATYVKFSSSEPSVATVTNDGEIEIKKAGTTTITASISDNDKYKDAKTSYELKVIDPNATVLNLSFFNITGSGYAAFSKADSYNVKYSTVSLKSNDNMQFNSGNNRGAGIVVTDINPQYLIESIDIEMNTDNNKGFNIYTSQTGFNALTTSSAFSTSGLTPINKSVIGSSTQSIEINAPAFAMIPSATGALYVASVTVHYKKNEDFNDNQVARPTFSPAGGMVNEGTEVTLSCATGGATIHYQIDEESEQVYSAESPIVITKDCTIKAWATADGMDKSDEVTAIYTVKKVITSIADAFARIELPTANNGSSEVFTVGFEPTITYVNGSNYYIFDGEKYGFVYSNKIQNGAAAKKLVKGWDAVITYYNGYYEFVPQGNVSTEAAEAVEPITVNSDYLTADNIFAYVKLNRVTFEAATPETKDSFNGKFEDTEINFYNSYTLGSVEAGLYNVTAIISTFNGDLQLQPTAYQRLDKVAAPVFSVPSGSKVSKGYEVTISCATDGATIMYTLDADTYEEYVPGETHIYIMENETFIWAYAELEGAENSEEEAAEYNLFDEDDPYESMFTFDFCEENFEDIYLMGDNYDLSLPTESAQETSFNGVTFTSDSGVSVAFANVSAQYNPRWYYSTAQTGRGVDVRVYKGNTITVSAPENYVVTKIEFRQLTGHTNWEAITCENGTFINNKEEKEYFWTANYDESLTSVTLKPTGACVFNYIDVTYERQAMRHTPAAPSLEKKEGVHTEIIVKNPWGYHDLYYKAMVYDTGVMPTEMRTLNTTEGTTGLQGLLANGFKKSAETDETVTVIPNDDNSVTHTFSSNELVKANSDYQSVTAMPAGTVLHLITVTHDPVTDEVGEESHVGVNSLGNLSGIEDVTVGAGEAEYFNLQGVRMNEPLAPGLYIRRQGNAAEKVYIR